MSFEQFDNKEFPKCVQHGLVSSPMIAARQFIGGTSSFRMDKDEVVQLGKRFKNAKEMDRHLKENNLEPCHVDSIKPKETPMEKIRKSKSYREGVEGWTKAINEARVGGVDAEVTRLTGIKAV